MGGKVYVHDNTGTSRQSQLTASLRTFNYTLQCVYINTTESYSVGLKHYTPYSARTSSENTHKFMGIYMEVLIPGIIL